MNENINIAEILKDAPIGTNLYSPLFGEILFSSIMNDEIICYVGDDVYFQGWEKNVAFNKYGQLLLSPVCSSDPTREVMIFPCEDSRDWSTFKAPWKHKHFEPFDKVMVQSPCRNLNGQYIIRWIPELYGYWNSETKEHVFIDRTVASDKDIFPFDKDLVGKEVENG